MANSSSAIRVVLGLLAISLHGASASTSTSLSIGITPTTSPYYAGETLTLNAGLVASGVPGGTVTFTIDGTASAPVAINTSKTASLTYNPSLGTHSITASYSGDDNYSSSQSGPLSITVFKAVTSIAMTPNQAQIAQSVAIRAAVTVQSPSLAIPTGTVDFVYGTNPISGCSNVPVQDGVAICTTSFAQIGTYTIGANYSGDANTAPTIGSLQLTVKCGAGVSLTANPLTPTNGGAVTLAVATSGATGVPGPTGTVTISDGATTLATLPLGTDGRATLVVPSGSLAPFSSGTHVVSAVYNGDTNYQASQAPTVSVVMGGKATSAVTVSATNSPQIAQSVRITAGIAVTGNASATPAGTVDFTNGTAAITGCTGVSVQGASAVCNTSFTQLGTLTIGASYSGDTNTAASKGTMQLTVGKGTAQIALSATPASPSLGVPVTLTALVTGMQGLAAPMGNITFSDGTAVLGLASVGSDGRASLTVPSGILNPFAAGTHNIGAAYGGDGNYLASAGPTLVLTVSSKAAAAITLSATPASPAPGVPVTLTALVTGVSGLAAPTGSVAFSDGTATLGSVMLGTDGRASLTVPTASLTAFTAGTHNIGAVYNGDGNYAVSPAATLVLVVSSKPSPVVKLSATPASPTSGVPVTLTASVTGLTGLATPTGTVAFSDGAAALGSVTLGNDGRASLTVPSGNLAAFTAGTHNIGAVYNGDANYAGSTAVTLALVVSSKPATTVMLSASPSSPSQGTPVTITALVAGLPGLAIPIGSVAFSDGTTPLGSVTLGGDGRALLTVPSGSLTAFSTGTHNIGAVYGGDTNYAGSTATLALVVSSKAAPTVTLSASPSSPSQGTPVTITALVTGTAGLATPAGTVAFSDGAAALGSVALGSDGRASLTVPSGSVAAFTTGTHNIGAVYSGDPNYAGSTATLALVVSKPATVLTLSATAAQLAQPLKITAAISVSTAGGTVDFTAGSNAILGCSGLPVQSGAAVCNTSFSQLGTVTIGAAYSGDGTNSPATASLPLTVNKCNPGAYLASSPNSPVYGATVTLGMLVMGSTGVANPTGTVTFSDNGTPLGTAPLGPDGHASLLAPSASIAALSAASHTIGASYGGDSNYASATAQSLTVTIGKAVPVVTVTAAPTSPAVGQSTTLTAALSPVGSGTVTFNNGSSAIAGCNAVAVQNGSAACVTTFSQSGAVSLTASYSGDTNLNAGSGVLALSVGQSAKTPSVSLVVNPTAPVFGAPTTFTLSVMATSGGPTPAGTVTFSDGATSLGSVPLSGLSQASLATPSSTVAALAAGTHTIAATYSGDSYYASTSATPLTVTVGKASTTTSLTAPYGGPFNATVSVVSPGAGTPTGQVQFSIGTSAIGTAILLPQGNALVASFPKNTQSGSLTATYVGDGNFTGSTSSAVTVGAPKAEISMTSNHNPSTFGQSVTFTVSAANEYGSSVPTGTVQLLSDNAALGTVTLSSGTGAFPTSSLAIGLHNLVANYSGDSNYPAASAGLLQVVNAGSGTLSLTSNASSSVSGQPVTLTAQWDAQSYGSAPTGQVQFSDGTTSLGTAPMSGGSASLAVASLAPGSHSLTATCTGDSNWAAVTSGVVTQVVSKAQTGTVLAPGSTAGTYTATVAPVAPGAGVPTGSVKFVNGATNAVIATVPLAATAATVDLTGVTDPIFASYSGDANFQASNSDPLRQIAVTNSASYSTLSVAEDEIVTLFGPNLGTAAAQASPPATTLGGTTVTVTDSAGVTRASQIFYVSAAQASILIPSGVAQGPGSLTVTNANRAPVTTTLTIGKVAPGLFTSNATGQGVAAAQAIRVHADGTQEAPQNVGIFDSSQNLWVPSPIDLGSSTDTVYLLLYGTGIRHASATPSCTIGGKPAGVVYAGAQGSFVGLDQVNVLLPATLRGVGTVNLTLMVDGVTANTVAIAVQ